MGLHNRITKERYNQIKKYLTTPADDRFAVAEFGIGYTTARNIRRTKDYQAYCERVFRFHNNPKSKKYELYKPTKEYWERLEYLDSEPKEKRLLLVAVVAIIVFMILMLAAIVLVAYLVGRSNG